LIIHYSIYTSSFVKPMTYWYYCKACDDFPLKSYFPLNEMIYMYYIYFFFQSFIKHLNLTWVSNILYFDKFLNCIQVKESI